MIPFDEDRTEPWEEVWMRLTSTWAFMGWRSREEITPEGDALPTLPCCSRLTGKPHLTPLLPTHIIRRGPKSDRSY